MKRTLVALTLAAGLATPAMAQDADAPAEQDCLAQVTDVRAQLETAAVNDEERAEIEAALMEAEQAAQAGEEATCAAIVQQVQAAVGVQ